jgi:hypothetical protein
MKRTTKLLVVIATAVSTVAFAGVGWTYWSTIGSGAASATVGTVASPSNVQATSAAGSGTVGVTWTGVASPSGVSADLGYWVQRSKDGGAYTNACGSSHTSPLAPSTVSSCNDTSLADGSYTYKVTAVFRSWTAASSPSSAVAVSNFGPLDHFLLTAPSTATAGTPFGLTVTAQDATNRTVATFAGQVHFTSTDSQATSGSGLPADYTFTTGAGADNGVHVFANEVTLKTAGNRTVSVSGSGKSGTSATITVSPATVTSLVLAAASTTPTAGVADSLTITAKDAYGNTATGYTGDKSLTFGGASAIGSFIPTVTNKAGDATSFGGATTIAFTSGVATVSGSANGVMTLYKAETASITVSDGTISNGTGLSVTVAAASPSALCFIGATSCTGATYSVAQDGTKTFAVGMVDSYGNAATRTVAVIINVTKSSPSNQGGSVTPAGNQTIAIGTSQAPTPITVRGDNNASGHTTTATATWSSGGTTITSATLSVTTQ